MKVSAFTAIRNGTALGYPWVEAVLSVLPAVDEYVIVDHYSTDGTDVDAERLRRNFPDKIRVEHAPWPTVRVGGQSIGLAQTNALRLCTGDVRLLVQADEIHHSDSVKLYPWVFKNFMQTPNNGMEFHFRHVIHNFQEEMATPAYTQAIRLVKNKPDIISCHDGFSFWYAEPKVVIDFPQPIYHCGYEFPTNIPQKHLSHVQLYTDMDIYHQAASDAPERLERAQAQQFDEVFLRSTSPIKDLPEILHGLVGRTSYEIRWKELGLR